MSLLKIGNKKLAYSGTFLVPEAENAEAHIPVEGWLIKLKFNFADTSDKSDHSIQIASSANELNVTFRNWNNTLGVATSNPIKIGNHQNGETIYLMASSHSIGIVRLLNVQILLGGENEQS